jgi:excisionase family DNA binding protein
MTNTDESAGLLYGGPEIARYLKITPKTLYHLVKRGGLPVFRMAGRRTLCARKDSLIAALDELEAGQGVR